MRDNTMKHLGAVMSLALAVTGGCSATPTHAQTAQTVAQSALPPPLTAGHGELEGPSHTVRLGDVGTLQVDPGPYQIWEDWGAGWKLVGFVNVTAPTTNTRMERWAFLRFDATSNPNGYHTPSSTNPTTSLWLGRTKGLTDSQGEIVFASDEGPNQTTNDQQFQGNAVRALKVLAGIYGGVTTTFTFINAAASCPTNLQNCSLSIASDGAPSATPPTPSATPPTPSATPAAH